MRTGIQRLASIVEAGPGCPVDGAPWHFVSHGRRKAKMLRLA